MKTREELIEEAREWLRKEGYVDCVLECSDPDEHSRDITENYGVPHDGSTCACACHEHEEKLADFALQVQAEAIADERRRVLEAVEVNGSGFCDHHYQFALIRHYLWMRLVVKMKPSVYAPSRLLQRDFTEYITGAWATGLPDEEEK